MRRAQQKPIERIVCAGGGARGVEYPGTYKAMLETGVFKGVQQLSGVSVGSFTAACMALGMSVQTMHDNSLKNNLLGLMGNSKDVPRNTPGDTAFTRDGKPLEEFIRNNIITAAKENLERINVQQLIGLPTKVSKLIRRITDEPQPRITFADLALLNKHFPDQFKQLTISAAKFPNGELQVFNSTVTPDIEIAIACRASASIPIVLEPATVVINGQPERFVDGALFDNIPTQRFDLAEDGVSFTENKKPEQTMVFAFAEGENNNKNPVFKALYGTRWDEVVQKELLGRIIAVALSSCKKYVANEGLDSSEDPAQIFKDAVKYILQRQVNDKKMSAAMSKAIMDGVKKSIDELKIQESYKKASPELRLKKLTAFAEGTMSEAIIKYMKPVLKKPGILEEIESNILVNIFGGLKTPYKNTNQDEAGFQRVREKYALRTVELRTGDLQSSDFNAASKSIRVLDALGYLNTINYITNYQLYDPQVFDDKLFYTELVTNFEHIYKAALLSSRKDPVKDSLLREIKDLRSQLSERKLDDGVICRQVYQLIKDKVEFKTDSLGAFALTRAVEYHNGSLDAKTLFKETCDEGEKRDRFLSAFYKIMNKENMCSKKAMDALNHIEGFKEAYNCATCDAAEERSDLSKS